MGYYMKDLISRKWLMECVDEGWIKFDTEKDTNTYIHLVRDIAPSAQPEPKWIPCSERLPEDNRQVLIYAMSVHYALAKYDEMRETDGTYKKQWVTFDAWKPFYTIKEVVAWMPLPEPYREDDHDHT